MSNAPYQQEGSQWGGEMQAAHGTKKPATDDGPREFTTEELPDVDVGAGPVQERYYAVRREDMFIGTAPKIDVLYVTEDGTRAGVRMHRARTTEGEHEFLDDVFSPVIARVEGWGDIVTEESRREHADAVARLYQRGGDQ